MDEVFNPGRQYKYTSLTQPTHFRLFYLDPGPVEAPHISGTLREHDIDDPPDYECLSYVWGTEEKNASVSIDQGNLAITESLRTALAHLRKPDTVKIVWIDQVAINQEDMAERSQQVQQMGRIYKQAQRDLVWLGESTEASALAFHWFINFFKTQRPGLDINNSTVNSQSIGSYEDAFLASASQKLALRECFVMNPIWTRIWIVQEMLLAREILLLHGTHILPWRQLELVLQCVNKRLVPDEPAEQNLFSAMFSHLISIVVFRTRIRGYLEPPLADLPLLIMGRKATNPRDTIYGLLGLASNPGITPDYTKSISEVFCEFTTALTKQLASLEFICFNQIEPHQRHIFGLPSWVPDWSTSWGPSRLPGGTPMFKAGTDSRCHGTSFSIVENVLISEGCHVDTIETISAAPSVSEYFGHDFSQMNVESHAKLMQIIADVRAQMFKVIPDHMKPHSPILAAPSTQYDGTWRTLICDMNTFGQRITEQGVPVYRARFLTWCKKMSSGDNSPVQFDPSDFTLELVTMFLQQRRLGITKRLKLLVSVHKDADVGDEICILRTAVTPLVMRNISNEGSLVTCKRIGTAYVHGLMDGEAWANDDMYPLRTYKVV